MSSGSPSHIETPNYVFGEPPNVLGTPFRYTASTFPLWQQTYSPTNAATPYTPSQFTTLASSATGIFQYNSVPPPPKIRTKKRPNNENPDTPAPKRARKTGITAPLSSIAPSDINKNLESAPSGSSSVGLSDTDNKKLTRFFDFLRDDLQWSYGKLLYCTTIGKAPGAIKDKTGKSTNTKVVQRNAAVIQHFMNGTGKYGPSQILEN